MGFFDKLFGKKNTPTQKRQDYSSDAYAKKIQEQYYSDFSEIPFVSPARKKDINWTDMITIFPNMLVEREMMKRNPDGLLPGEVYLLYWIDHFKEKKDYPVYFEYRYGIDPSVSKTLLIEKDLLFENHATEKGKAILSKYNYVLEAHSPGKTSSKKAKLASQNEPFIAIKTEIEHPLFSICDPFEENGVKASIISSDEQIWLKQDLHEINRLLAMFINRLPKKSVFEIRIEFILFRKHKKDSSSSTYLSSHPTTPSGRKSKYHQTIYFATRKLPSKEIHEGNSIYFLSEYDAHGVVDYLEDGSIGKAWLNIWHYRQGYHIDIAKTTGGLTLKKVRSLFDGEDRTIYQKEFK